MQIKETYERYKNFLFCPESGVQRNHENLFTEGSDFFHEEKIKLWYNTQMKVKYRKLFFILLSSQYSSEREARTRKNMHTTKTFTSRWAIVRLGSQLTLHPLALLLQKIAIM